MADRLCICTSGTGRGWQDWLAMLLISGVLLAAIILPQLKSTYPLTYDELVYLRKTRAYDQWLRDGWAHALSGQPLWLFSLEAVQEAEQLPDMHPGVVKLVGLLPHWLVKATLHREGGARLTGAEVYVDRVELYADGTLVAAHARTYARGQTILELAGC